MTAFTLLEDMQGRLKSLLLKHCNFVTFLNFKHDFLLKGHLFLKLDFNVSFAVTGQVKPGFTTFYLIGQGDLT